MIYSTVGHFFKIYPYPQKYVTSPLLSQIDSFSHLVSLSQNAHWGCNT